MSTPFRATDLLAELPRLRRYARVLTGDSDLADRLVEETLLRFRRISDEALPSPAQHLELLALLRDVNAENAPTGSTIAPPSASSPRTGPNPSVTDGGFPRPATWVHATPSKSLPERTAKVLAQLGELPIEQREVLVLVAVEQLSYRDIATLLRIPVATVLSRLSQAREALHLISTRAHSAPNNAS